MTKGNDALAALATLLGGVAEGRTACAFARNPAEEVTLSLVAAQGPRSIIVLRDGDTGEPDVTLSPPTYEYEHTASIELAVLKGKDDTEAVFADIVAGIAALFDPQAEDAADPTLGGVVDWCELGGLSTDEVDAALQRDFKAAIIPVTLTYTTTSPLG
jgi:hypothetical protein